MIQTAGGWQSSEQAAGRLPSTLSVADWADRFRHLDSRISPEPGRWRTRRTPYLKEVMDSFVDPGIDEVVLMSASQVGKTEGGLNCLGYAAHQDPGPALWVNAREIDAKRFSKNRIFPMFEASPGLRELLPANTDKITHLEINLQGMNLFLAGAASPAGLASNAIRYLFLDEVDKYPKFSGAEADPVALAQERTKNFWNRFAFKVSTPTTRAGYIFRAFELSDARRYYLPCPYCGKYQILAFPQVKWSEGSTAESLLEGVTEAAYECRLCSEHWDDGAKLAVLADGVWVPDGMEIADDGSLVGDNPPMGSTAGFHLSALYSPWISFSQVAAKFLSSYRNPNELMNFTNSWLAEIWEEKSAETKEDLVRTRIHDYEIGTVPAKAQVLTAAVDVQANGFFITIRAWGENEESWLVMFRQVETWEQVEAVIFRTEYPRTDTGETLTVTLALIDSGYRTDEVYRFTRDHSERCRSIKGRDNLLSGQPFSVTNLERHPKTGRVVPYIAQVWHLDTTYYKEKLHRLIHQDPEIPGGWHLPRETTPDYIAHMCSEHKVIERNRTTGKQKELWKKVHEGAENHYWDCEVYNTAAGEMLRVDLLRGSESKVFQKAKKRRSGPRTFGGGDWVGGSDFADVGAWEIGGND